MRRLPLKLRQCTAVHYRSLGRCGLQVTAVGLGSWLTFGGSVAEDVAAACIDRAWELGIRFFDTANVYAGGGAERVLGRHLAPRPRDEYVLATKVYFPMGPTPTQRGLSRKHVLEQCAASLRRLGVDYVDLYQCHRYDESTPLEETCRAMDDLVRRGMVLYWGVSEWTATQIEAAVDLCRQAGWTAPVSDQPQYHALYRRIEADVLPACARLGLGCVVWSPLAQGVLTGKYTDPRRLPPGSRAAGPGAAFMERFLRPEVLNAVQRLRPVAEAAGITLAQLALAWCLRRNEVSAVIVGATRPEQLEETAAAADVRLGREVIAAVDEILGPVAVT